MQITKQQMQDYILRYADDQETEDEGEEAWVEANVKLVFESETHVEHKSAWNSNVYQAGDLFFEVTFTRDNSGYWSDGESYPAEIQEVKPVQVTRTEYVAI